MEKENKDLMFNAAKTIYEYPGTDENCKAELVKMFPALKESEDERIRKEIIQFLQLPHHQFVGKRNHEEWIAYLEKQKEQKTTEWSEEDKEIMHDIIKYHYDQGEISSKHNKWASWLEHKSFSPQSHWKPSKEQMKALEDAFRKDGGNEYRKVINSLYCDLQKLL